MHVLPITDKRKAVLDSMWFHLEQVKQCRKIDPSSVAFQRPVRNSPKSYRANPTRNCRGTKAAGARAVVTSLRRARVYLLTFGGFTLTETSRSFSLFWCHCGLFYCFSSNPPVFSAGSWARTRPDRRKQVLHKNTSDLSGTSCVFCNINLVSASKSNSRSRRWKLNSPSMLAEHG